LKKKTKLLVLQRGWDLVVRNEGNKKVRWEKIGKQSSVSSLRRGHAVGFVQKENHLGFPLSKKEFSGNGGIAGVARE